MELKLDDMADGSNNDGMDSMDWLFELQTIDDHRTKCVFWANKNLDLRGLII